MAQTLDQQRANMAYAHVALFKEQGDRAKQQKYAAIVHKVPILIQTAGLCQALHFVASRSPKEQKVYALQLGFQLRRAPGQVSAEAQRVQEPNSLDGMLSLVGAQPSPVLSDALHRVRSAGMMNYLGLTQEAMACATWYRRLVQGVLGIEAGSDEPLADSAAAPPVARPT